MKRYPFVAALAVLVAACGGDAPDAGGDAGAASQPAAAAPAANPSVPAPPTGELSIPDWYTVDNASRTVTIAVSAGSTPDNNYWNFNGAINGELAITVPVGYTVSMELINLDPNMAHSMGVQAGYDNPMLPPTPDPAFPGAVTPNPQSMIDGTMPGQSAKIEFVASEAGEYKLICYVPGHTAVGMWLYFIVSEGDEAGVRGL